MFYRKELGDIDLPWGSQDEKRDLEHIIKKHVNDLHDFKNVNETMTVVDDVIRNGENIKDKWDKATITKDGYKVVVRKNTRDDDGNILDEDKRWVVTAFDGGVPQKEKHLSPP